MTTKHTHDTPILVTGAAGAVGGIGRNLTEFLLAKGHKVRAMVRREDERAEALRRLGAEVVQGVTVPARLSSSLLNFVSGESVMALSCPFRVVV